MDQHASKAAAAVRPADEAVRDIRNISSQRPALQEKIGAVNKARQSSAEGKNDEKKPIRKAPIFKPVPTRLHNYEFPLVGEPFASPQAFFMDCNRASSRCSGYRMKCIKDISNTLIAECELKSCPVKCTATRKSSAGSWVVTREGWCEDHKHGEWEGNGDDMEPAAWRWWGPRSLAVYQATFPGTCPVIPSLPQAGDLFRTPEALLITLRTILVPNIGVSVRKQSSGARITKFICNHSAPNTRWSRPCTFRLACDKMAEGAWRVREGACYDHGHGRDRRLIEDPTWRPIAQGGKPYDEQADLRELAMINGPPLRPSPKPLSTTSVSLPRLKRSSSVLSSSSCSSDSSISDSSSDSSDSDSSSAPSIADPIPQLNPAARPAAEPVTISSTAPFSTQVSSLLTTLSPSLSVLGPLLQSAGITDRDLLLRFLAMDDDNRERLLKDAGVGVLERCRAVMAVADAREGGWKVEGGRPRK